MKQLLSLLCAPFFTNQPACLYLILTSNIVTKGDNSAFKVEDTVTPERDGAEGDKWVGSEFIITLPFKN